MPTDTKLNQLIINQLTQEQYDEAKAAGTLSDTELYITDSDDDALTNNKITNCITYIPQDIKLELNNGTLTLKAGSKVYYGDGSVININSDLTTTSTVNSINFIRIQEGKLFADWAIGTFSSGTDTTGYTGWFFNINDKTIAYYNNGVKSSGTDCTLPLGVVTVSNGTITSIDQVFNGFGYIGSTVFALPGVKGLIPNSRNADGSLKSIEFTLDKVLTYNCTMSSYFGIKFDGTEPILGIYGEQLYNSSSNTVIFKGVVYKWMYSGSLIYSNGRITSFTPKTVFHALDYNDKSTISGWSMPSGRFIDLTLGASDSTYTAPANGWFCLAINNGLTYLDIWNSNGLGIAATNYNNGFIRRFVPAFKGDVIRIFYHGTPNTALFRFIYAEGE